MARDDATDDIPEPGQGKGDRGPRPDGEGTEGLEVDFDAERLDEELRALLEDTAPPAGTAGRDPQDEVDLDAPEPVAETPTEVAVILTGLASTEACAAACRLAGVDAWSVPTPAGVVAVLGEAAEDRAAAGVAVVSRMLAQVPVVLLRRGPSSDPGAGDVQAGRWLAGEKVADLPPGLFLMNMPQEVEAITLGITDPRSVPGALNYGSWSTLAATRALARAVREARRQAGQ